MKSCFPKYEMRDTKYATQGTRNLCFFTRYEIRGTKYEVPVPSNEQRATSDESQATDFFSRDTRYEVRNPLVASRDTSHASRFTFPASRFTFPASRFTFPASHSSGFTLLEVIGVLAVLATLMAILVPNLVDQMDRAVQETEAKNLRAIGQGVEAYLVQNLDWPNNLSGLAPEYVPFDGEQLKDNPRGYERYLEIHPDATPYNNGNGIAPSDLTDFRFMVITDLTQDVNPNTNNAANFDSWWDTDDSINPDLLIYRGTIKPLLYLVSLSAVGEGGSYRIDGNKTSAGGSGTLATYGQYHLKGSLVELSEDDNFGGGSGVTISFTLTADAGYQWDPNCSDGTKWHVLGAKC